MSERFRIVFLTNPIMSSACSIEDTEQPIITYYNDLTYNMGSAKQICELLNQLNNENEELKEELTCYKSANDKLQKELIKKVEEKSKLKIENKQLREENKELKKENEQLKQKMGVLLYQIGEAGKNNKTCKDCVCFTADTNRCWMWDMEVEADDVVVACDQRKVKKRNENE